MLPVITAFAFEKYIFSGLKNPRTFAILVHTVLILAELIVPFKIVWEFRGNTFLNIYVLTLAMMITMKLTSYAHVMGDLR